MLQAPLDMPVTALVRAEQDVHESEVSPKVKTVEKSYFSQLFGIFDFACFLALLDLS